MVTNDLRYAGFGKRFLAFFLDFAIILPLAIIANPLMAKYRLFNLYAFLPNLVITFFLSIYLVKRFGGTPGKMIMRIKITKLNGSPVTYKEAILRCAPDIIFWLITVSGVIFATLQMSDSEFLSLTPKDRHNRLFEQPWLRPINIISEVWILSEFIVLLTNKKRRALYDFLAGTVVIHRSSNPPAS
jgi:uncharacterized RDD family membrane protein YckC